MQQTSETQESKTSEPELSVTRAILTGHVVVNVPAVLIMLVFACPAMLFITVVSTSNGYHRTALSLLLLLLLALAGFTLGWMWWSFAVPRWRRWALRKGVPADELQKWGVRTGLVWPKGSIFEKTEFKLPEERE